MITYNLLLCHNAFSQFFLGNGIGVNDRKDNSKFAAIVDQHKVVLSPHLLDYYHEHVSAQGALYELLFEQIFCSNFYSLQTSQQYTVVNDEEADYKTIDTALQLLSRNKELNNPLIMCDECERCEKFIQELKPQKPVFSSALLENSIYNKVKRNTLPFALQVTGNEQSGAFTHWFGELFHDEKAITIIDPYIISKHGLFSFLTYYIPKIEYGTKVILYTNSQNCEDINDAKGELATACNTRRIKIEVFTSRTKKDQMHGRHLFLSSAHLCLDHGLDFLDATNNTIRDCYITVTEREENDLSKLLHVHKYYLLFEI